MTHVAWVSTPNALRAHRIYHRHYRLIIIQFSYNCRNLRKTSPAGICLSSVSCNHFITFSVRIRSYKQRYNHTLIFNTFHKGTQLYVLLHMKRMVLKVL